MKVHQACKKFGVPETTLRDIIAGRTSENKSRTGPETILTGAEEKAIEDWIIALSKCGFPLKKGGFEKNCC